MMAQEKLDDSPLFDYNQPKVYEVGGITITGTEYLNEDILVRLSGLGVGDKISVPGEDIPKAIKALWKQKLFADVKIYATKVVNNVIFLEVSVKERPRLSKYKFNGVKKTEEDELRDRLLLRRGRIVDENLRNRTVNSVKSYYIDKGFLNVQVETKDKIDEEFSNTIILTIDVNRGNKIKINEIIVNGNDQILSRKIRKQMKETKERTRVNPEAPLIFFNDMKKAKIGDVLGNLSPAEALQYIDENVMRVTLFKQSKFLEEKYDEDLKAIIALYNEKGYRDARIASDSMYFVNDKAINLVLNVEEGQQYYFRNIEWKGNSKYTDKQLDAILGIKKGDVYNQTALQMRLFMDPNANDVSSLYMDDGYLFFQVNPEEQMIEGDSIDLQLNVYEGAQATVNKVIISGNSKTHEHVIRRELRSLPGTKFSRSDIIRSQREIAALGMFDPEQIQINPIPNPANGTVDIEYKVTEKASDQLELSAGWGQGGIVGSLGVSLNNFSLRNAFNKGGWQPIPSGDGQKLALRFQSTGSQYQALTGSFTEPWLGGKKPNALSVAIFTQRQCFNCFSIQNRIVDEEDRQQLMIYGGTIGIGQRLRIPDDNFILRTELSYQHYRLNNYNFDFIINDGVSNDLNFRVELSRYSIDQPIFPRSGSNIMLSLQITPPYSLISGRELNSIQSLYKWAEYHKWKFKAEWFTSIVGNLVLRTSAKMGLMGFYNNKIGYSPFERFQLGGDGLAANFGLYGRDIIGLRGYQPEHISSNPNSNQGDPFYSKYTLELRYPLTLNPSSTVYALAFVEAGDSWGSFKEFNPFQLKRSAGLGLRIFLPMFGTLGFDYALGFDKPGINQENLTGVSGFLNRFAEFHVILGVEPE